MEAPPASLAKTATWYVFFALLFNLGFAGLIGSATGFLLKDGFRLGPEEMARYGLIIAIPGYLGILYSNARDRLAPRLGGDRGVMRIGHSGLAIAYGALAIVGPSYMGLIVLTIATNILSAFTVGGLNGALVTFGRRREIADRLAGFLLVVGTGTASVIGLMAGWSAAHLPYRTILGLMVVVNVAAMLWISLAPRGAFGPSEPIPPSPLRWKFPLAQDIANLVRHRPYLIAVGIGMTRGLGLVTATVVFYEYTNRLKAGPEVLGGSGAVGGLVVVVVGLLYLKYARRWTLRQALALGILLGIPGPILILVVRTPADLFPVAIWGGIAATFFSAPHGELLLRSIPPESAGLGYNLNGTFDSFVGQGTSLLGAWVYARYGIETCVALSLPLPLLGLLLVALIPKDLAGRPPETAGA